MMMMMTSLLFCSAQVREHFCIKYRAFSSAHESEGDDTGVMGFWVFEYCFELGDGGFKRVLVSP